jgi:hypothetical protein
MNRHQFFQLLVAATLFSIGETTCLADEHSHEGREARRHESHGSWHGDIRHFHEYDMPHWRAGHWYQGWHDGRHAWWWIVGGVWYFYPRPVYPYPDPYQPPIVVVPQPSQPPVVVAPQPSQTPPAATQYWYYCPNPAGYYPYVAQCQTDWQKVPATIPPDLPH